MRLALVSRGQILVSFMIGSKYLRANIKYWIAVSFTI